MIAEMRTVSGAVAMPQPALESRRILGMRVDATTYRAAADHVIAWARQHRSCYVCLGTVNNVMEAHDSAAYRRVMEGAALVTPDGMPLVWMLRLLGVRHATRVYGPDLTPHVLEAAEAAGVPVGFYGASPAVLARLVALVRSQYPGLGVAFVESPPFRPLTPEEDERVTGAIRESRARILFVGLGSPKQDIWMAEHQGRIPAVMLGVGAAFDFIAGAKPQAPAWMRNSGLEWLFRLSSEPRRLCRRYLWHNSRFLALLFFDFWRRRSPATH